MLLLDLQYVDLEEYLKDAKELVDKVNDAFRQIAWFLRQYELLGGE